MNTTPFTPSTSTSFELITGNTYPVKDQIKALGGKWSAASKGWLVPAENAAAAWQLVGNAPAPAPRSDRSGASRYRSNYAYFPSTGGEYYRNKAGRCIDAPCCGCCS